MELAHKKELIYYVRVPDSREVLEEVFEEYDFSPDYELGPRWFIGKAIAKVKLSKGVPCGVVVSNGYDSVGWSAISHRDTFSKKKGLMIAREREKNGFNYDHVPEYMKEHIYSMLEKSRTRFNKE